MGRICAKVAQICVKVFLCTCPKQNRYRKGVFYRLYTILDDKKLKTSSNALRACVQKIFMYICTTFTRILAIYQDKWLVFCITFVR